MVDLQRYLQDVANARRAELLPLIFAYTGGSVQTGPFAGTMLTPNYMWGDGDTAAKLLGVYEDELHPSIKTAIAANPDLVINVGCAEGYYALGAKRATNAITVIVDIELRALEIAKINAAANNLSIDAALSSITPEELEVLLAKVSQPWLILDCEGYEDTLLDLDKCPSLAKSMILAETHDTVTPGLTQKIVDRFAATHRIECIFQGPKNPYQFDFLRSLSDCDKWALVHEGRPMGGSWVWMEPK